MPFRKGESTSHSFGPAWSRGLHCYVDLIAIQKTLDTERKLIFGFSSFLEDGWSVGRHRGSMAGHYVRRHPKALLSTFGVASEELLSVIWNSATAL